MVKRKIVKAFRYRLESKDMDAELMQRLIELQTKYPDLEWDFNLYAVNFLTCVSFRGYETVE